MIYRFSKREVPSLSQAGGKAKALIETTKAGFNVPEGFVLAVDFFNSWMQEIKSAETWKIFLESPTKEMCDQLKSIALKLGFTKEQKEAIDNELIHLSENAVFAVRSSSPEEDLKDKSFAGQYETILGVRSGNLERAVVEAFASMLDIRVVEYKKLNNLPIYNPKIAVIVQKQIKSEVSGIAFSLNPNNNSYDEAVINASFGLGETIVSGRVTPDTYIVEKVKKQIISKKITDKSIGLWLKDEGGTVEKEVESPKAPALTDEQILQVSELASACEKHYEKPMDIEWAIEGETLYLLQARPITTYIPFYEEMITKPEESKNLYLDLMVLTQGFSDNLSVMGQEIWTKMLVAAKYGLAPEGKDGILFNVHGRQYMHLSNQAKGLGIKSVEKGLGIYETPIREIFKTIDLKKDYMPAVKTDKMKKIPRSAIKVVFMIIPNIIKGMMNTQKAAHDYKVKAEEIFRYLKNDFIRNQHFDQLVDEGISKFSETMKSIVYIYAAVFAMANLKKMFKDEDADDLLIALSMDLPNNPTSEMGHHMLRLASYDEIQKISSNDEFISRLSKNHYSEAFLNDFNDYVERFGARGFKEIDIASPRTSENLAGLFEQLKHINIEQNPMDTVKERKAQAYEKLLGIAKKLGKEKRFIKAARTYNDIWGLREHPKYIYVVMVGEIRKRALQLGETFVSQGRLNNPEQIFDLTIEQVTMAESNPEMDLLPIIEKNLAPRKKLEHIAEWPKIVDSRGKIFRYIPEGEEGDLKGEAIAPGTVRGKAKVLSSPYEKPLEKGEILVTKATEPSWTPIFINAAGVVLEIGGPLQHGAIIAREYGIPCVSGIEGATKTIKDGDLLEVGGSSGLVKIIKGE